MEAGAQPPQLLADGEVSMAFAFNGRIFNAAQGEGKPFKIVWDGQIYEMEGWVVPKGAPHLDAARDFIAFSTAPEQQARAAEFISYGPPRKSAAAMVGNIEGTGCPDGAEPADFRRQHEAGAGIEPGVLGRPRRRTGRNVSTPGWRRNDDCRGGAAPPRAKWAWGPGGGRKRPDIPTGVNQT